MRYETIIFDLDGTISDPFEGISKSVNHALSSLGYEPADTADIRRMIGPPLTEIFEELIGEVKEQHMLDLVDRYRDRYASVGYTENVIYDGIPETIAALSANGGRMGVCTSKRADYATKIVEMFGLGGLFEFVDGGDVHIRKSQQLERLVAAGIKAETAVMVGDRAVDIDAAKRNGLDSVGVCWGFGEEEELDNAGPNHVARTPDKLLELLV